MIRKSYLGVIKAVFGALIIFYFFFYNDSSRANVNTPIIKRSFSASVVFVQETTTHFKDLREVVSYVKALNPEIWNELGYSLSLSADGNTFAVGAPGEDSYARVVGCDQTNEGEENLGAVYVFVRDEDNWTQQTYTRVLNGESGDYLLDLNSYGPPLVALEEDGYVGGVEYDQENNEKNSGVVHVFAKNGEGWSQQAYILAASNTKNNIWFGRSLSLSGDGGVLVVGAPGEGCHAWTEVLKVVQMQVM